MAGDRGGGQGTPRRRCSGETIVHEEKRAKMRYALRCGDGFTAALRVTWSNGPGYSQLLLPYREASGPRPCTQRPCVSPT